MFVVALPIQILLMARVFQMKRTNHASFLNNAHLFKLALPAIFTAKYSTRTVQESNTNKMSSGNLFYYVTYKYVLLKDARLGVLYYVLALLTVLYTVVEIFIRKGYMEVNTDHKCGYSMQIICLPVRSCCICTGFAAIVGKGSTIATLYPLYPPAILRSSHFSYMIVLPFQFDTHPLGTVNLMLSDDFANEGFSSTDLPYCKGAVRCQYLDPWGLNWPRGTCVCLYYGNT